MKRILSGALALTLLLGTSDLAFADQYRGNNSDRASQSDRGDHGRYDSSRGRQDDRNWRQGQRVDRQEWNRWQRVDYRRGHMRRPARGHEWRRTSDGRYVEIAIATGLIIAILNSR